MRFQTAYQRLNPEQKRAVDKIFGAQLVIAGPGSGKTEILASRISQMLLSEAQIDPHNILSMTFTEAGVVAMHKRLVEFLGPVAYKVTIHTFHSFCNEAVQMNLDAFGMRELEPLSDLEAMEIVYAIIDDLPANNVLKRVKGDPYYETLRLKRLFQIMKEEGWDASYMEQQCQKHLKNLPLTDKYQYKRANHKKNIKPGDPNKRLIDAETDRIRKTIAAAKLLDQYEDRKLEMQRYDFVDMIQWVVQKFETDPNFLYSFQERYQYVLLDEYQDTNGIQNRLIVKLMEHWEDPNLFVVCDDDQALYEFNGARIRNIMDFRDMYSPDVVVLKQNYRSQQLILDCAMKVIDNNLNRLVNRIPDLDKDLRGLELSTMRFPMVYRFPKVIHEEYFYINVIKQIYEQEPENIGNVAVIYRKHKQAEEIIKELQVAGIPVNVKRAMNILEQSFTRKILKLLETVVAGALNIQEIRHDLMVQILHFDFFGVPRKEIEECYIKEFQGWAVDIDKFPKIAYVLDKMSGLYHDYHNEPVLLLIESILNELKILDFIAYHPKKLQLMAELNTFFAFVKGEIFKNPLLTAPDLLLMITKMVKERISIPVNDLNYEINGVNFMTAHGAKGLEFDHVFIMGATMNEWEKTRAGSLTFKIPEELTMSVSEDKLESNRRLFYVSMTRARKNLTITYAEQGLTGREQEPSQFIAETGITPSDYKLKVDDITNRYKQVPFSPQAEETFLRERIEGIVLSISAVNKFLGCPVSFYYENLLRVPFVANEALIYGNAMHTAFKLYYDAVKDKKAVNLGFILKEFEDYMRRNIGQLGAHAFQRRLAYGTKALKIYYQNTILPSNKITLNEVRFKVMIGDIPFQYIYDKMEFEGTEVDIVDYKTGKNKYAVESVKEPVSEEDPGGDYWRQMVAGKIVLDNIYWKDWHFRGARVEIIDEGYENPLPVIVTPAAEMKVIEQIYHVHGRLMALDFSGGCGECEWCNLQNINQ